MKPQPHAGGRPTRARKLLILERRRRVAAALVRGQSQWQIAQTEGVDPAQISRDLSAIRQEWRQSALIDFEARQAEELARIDAVEAEAWAAWDRSKQDTERRQARTVTTPSGQRTEASRVESVQCGDPRFLTQIMACVKHRCDLLGLSVTRVAPVTPDGKQCCGGPELLTLALERALAAAEAAPPGTGG
jgi:hypothetical protein